MCSLGSCEIKIPATILPVLNSLINDFQNAVIFIFFFSQIDDFLLLLP